MKKLIFILAVAALVVACGKKDKGGGNVAGTPTNPNTSGIACGGCSNSNRLYSALGRDGMTSEMILDLFAGSATVASVANNGYYNGPVDARGRWYVGADIPCNSFMFGAPVQIIPRGVYDIVAAGPGQIDAASGLIHNLRLEARGYGRIVHLTSSVPISVVTASPLLRSCNGYEFSQEMLASFRIEGVNGAACSYTIGYTGYNSHNRVCP